MTTSSEPQPSTGPDLEAPGATGAVDPVSAEPGSPEPVSAAPDAPDVTVDGTGPGSVLVTVTGEFTAEARRPVIRAVTDLLLGDQPPSAVRLDLRPVTFLNSAGLSTVVQLHRMLEGRGSELELVVGSTVVARPLQLSGLWHRFHVLDERRGN